MTFPRSLRAALALVWLVAVPASAQRSDAPAVIEVVAGTTPAGDASEPWLVLLRKRVPDEQYRSAAALRKALTPSEAAWASLVRSRAPAWEQMVPELALAYPTVQPPRRVHVVIGNRAGEDAFTHDAMTIGFDLASLQALYGDASAAENTARLDRFFRHEFNHVLQKAWLAQHPWPATTPLRIALLDIWAEGLGNYFSLSEAWAPDGGRRSPATARALAELEPRLVARLSVLACATPEASGRLLKGLSSGPFDQKWGALPAALWLKEEPMPPSEALRRFVAAGPDGVWDLATRHLPAPLRDTLREAKAAAEACAPR
jgi:hypothetical protein